MEERYKVTVTNDLQSVDIVDLQENKNVFSESFILLSTAHFICDLFNKIDKQEIKIKELEKENQQLKFKNGNLKEKVSTQLQNNADNVEFMENQRKEIEQLKEQLAESEKDRLMWQDMYKSADRQNKEICETDIYPLQEEVEQLKESQTQKAIEELEKLKQTLIPLRNLEIEAIRETNEYDFTSLEARKYWVSEHKENAKTYDNIIKKFDNQIKELS